MYREQTIPMKKNNYESGRLNLPFVGHCTFAKAPPCTDWDKIEADVAILGVPNDMGTQWRSGARMGPRSIREASTLFSLVTAVPTTTKTISSICRPTMSP